MAQLMLENTDAETKLKKAQLDKEAELRRRSQDDTDRCSTLQRSRTAALATCNAQLLQHATRSTLQRRVRLQCGRRNIPTTHPAYDMCARGMRRATAWPRAVAGFVGSGLTPLPHLHRDWAHPRPHLHRDSLAPPTSAPGLGNC